LTRDDGDAERGRLKEAGGHELAAPLGERPVEERRDGAYDDQRGEEERHAGEGRAAVEQARDVELDARRDEEERREDTEADRLQLGVEEGVCHRLVAVDELQRRAGEERAEDRLEAEPRRED